MEDSNMADPISVSLNKVRSNAVDLYNDLTHKKAEKQTYNAKMAIKIGDYLNGSYSVPTSQTAAADWDK